MTTQKINDSNDCSKRTAAKVNSILASNGIELKAVNQGDGNLFCICENNIKLRIKLREAGFIISKDSLRKDSKICYFNCFVY